MAQRRGKPIVRIFGHFMRSQKDDEAIERFRAYKHKENAADRFQDAIHAFYENAGSEKAMHKLWGRFAGYLGSKIGPTSPAQEHKAHTETPHTSFATSPIANEMPTAAAMMTRFVITLRLISMPERNATMIETRMIKLPAVRSDGSTVVAPPRTGSTGTRAPAK